MAAPELTRTYLKSEASSDSDNDFSESVEAGPRSYRGAASDDEYSRPSTPVPVEGPFLWANRGSDDDEIRPLPDLSESESESEDEPIPDSEDDGGIPPPIEYIGGGLVHVFNNSTPRDFLAHQPKRRNPKKPRSNRPEPDREAGVLCNRETFISQLNQILARPLMTEMINNKRFTRLRNSPDLKDYGEVYPSSGLITVGTNRRCEYVDGFGARCHRAAIYSTASDDNSTKLFCLPCLLRPGVLEQVGWAEIPDIPNRCTLCESFDSLIEWGICYRCLCREEIYKDVLGISDPTIPEIKSQQELERTSRSLIQIKRQIQSFEGMAFYAVNCIVPCPLVDFSMIRGLTYLRVHTSVNGFFPHLFHLNMSLSRGREIVIIKAPKLKELIVKLFSSDPVICISSWDHNLICNNVSQNPQQNYRKFKRIAQIFQRAYYHNRKRAINRDLKELLETNYIFDPTPRAVEFEHIHTQIPNSTGSFRDLPRYISEKYQGFIPGIAYRDLGRDYCLDETPQIETSWVHFRDIAWQVYLDMKEKKLDEKIEKVIIEGWDADQLAQDQLERVQKLTMDGRQTTNSMYGFIPMPLRSPVGSPR